MNTSNLFQMISDRNHHSFKRKLLVSALVPLHHIGLLGFSSAVSLTLLFHKMLSHGSHIDKKLRVAAGAIPKLY